MRNLLILLSLVAVLGTASMALADTVWAVEDASATRWSDDADEVAGDVKEGDRLEVIFRKEGLVRVKLPGAAGGFGWLPQVKVTAERPDGAMEMDLDLGNLPGGLELPGGLDLPGGGLPPIDLGGR